jgi:ubiquinone/menaquinone biosynthesis C-methylase UbiE
MVVEHIENPTPALVEVFRILKPNGIFIFHTTNLLNYQTFLTFLISDLVKNKLIEFLEGRKEEDIFPTYYRMNSLKKIKKLAQMSGFNVPEFKLINSPPKTIMLGPVVIIELLLIRVINLKLFRNFRSNIITVFQKINLPN